jgi:TolA-binding protein/HEAT repeat protein
MKCLTLLSCVVPAVLALSPASGQTPPAPPLPRAETPPPPKTPRAEQPWSSDKRFERDFADRQRLLEERQRELMDQQVERQRALEERQRELQDEQLQRQRELEERQREKMQEQEELQRELMQQQLERLHEREQRREEMKLDAPWPAEAPAPPVPMEKMTPRAAMLADALDGAFLNQRPPAPWAQRDPADSLYRVAREALNRGDYRRAAQLFNELTQRFPNSSYAYVSGYYEAFSRYRIGTTEELKAADRALRTLVEGGRSASSSNSGRGDDTDVNGLRTRIRGALAMRGDSDAADMVEHTARQAGASCDQEDLMVRVEALNALSQMDAAAALPILRHVLERRDDCLVELRRRAVFMLARRGDAEAASLLIATAKNDPNVNVRSEAISYLPRMPGDAGLTALEDILRTADDERVQRVAVRAIMSSENPRARTSLRGLLERRDASETLRMQVLEAYSRERSTPDDAAYLRWLYPRSESERMKLAIIGALARIGGKDNQDWLAAVVRNTSESSQLRSAALQRLSRSDIAISEIGRMYDAADSRSMREQLIAALAVRKEPEATDKLIEIAKNSTDLEMRRLAINYLSRKNDPRATRLLMELIEK